MIEQRDIENIVVAVKMALAPDFKELKQDVSKLKEDVKVLKEDVSGLKEDVRGLKEKVTHIEGEISDLKEMDRAILGEVVRVHEFAISETEKLHNQIERLMAYYHIAKEENSNTTLLVRRIDDLTRRVEVLEHQTA